MSVSNADDAMNSFKRLSMHGPLYSISGLVFYVCSFVAIGVIGAIVVEPVKNYSKPLFAVVGVAAIAVGICTYHGSAAGAVAAAVFSVPINAFIVGAAWGIAKLDHASR